MRYRYTKWDGTEFPTQASLGSLDALMEFVLAYGDRALEALDQMRMEMDDEHREWLEGLMDEGLLEQVGARWKLTPRAINRMQRKALMEIFRGMRPSSADGHESTQIGPGGERIDGTRRYTYGDPISEIDLSETLRNAITRRGLGIPIRFAEEDFELHRTESRADCSLVILLDMSGSMARYGRFYQAKLCAMAMHALVRQRFPQDTIDVIGFFSTAETIPEHKLPLVMPKPVTLFDYEVRLRVPIERAKSGPQHFTNLQLGLMQARRLLRRRKGPNKEVFIITDGQPTAHVQGDYVYLLYPPDERSAIATLKEAHAAAREGIRIATFALIEDYAGMDWVSFVDQLTKLTRGVAFYCPSGDLASCVVESYLSGKRTKAFIA
jgi:Ca-activated chloride channel family protein